MSACIENERVKVEFDRNTGAITGLLNKDTGWQVIRQPKLAMGIKLLVPIGQHRNNQVLSSAQRLAGLQTSGGQEAVLTWDRLVGDKSGELDISVVCKVSLHGPEVRFEIGIDNRSPYIVEEVWCPCLGGLREPREEAPLRTMSMHMWAGATFVPLGDGFPQACGYWGVDHPTFIRTFPDFCNQTPFVILTNGEQSLYLGAHDDELNIVNFVHELIPGYASCKNNRIPHEDEIDGRPAGFVVSAARMPFIQPGESMRLAPAVIGLYAGTWHEGMKPYLAWRETWFRPESVPAWVNETDCWMTLHINSPEGCCRYRYEELPGLMKEAKAYGVQVLQLIGWARDGQDGAEPYQATDPRLGTFEELKQAIRDIEEMGVRVLLMCKFKWADQAVPEYDEELRRHTLKDMYGNPVQFGGYAYQTLAQQLNGGSRRSGAGLCHLSEDYRKFALNGLGQILDLEPSGILYDELSNNMLLCFDETHGHRWGDSHFKGSLQLAAEFHRAAKARNPEFVLAGEGTNDPISQFYPINYVRTWNGAWMGEGEHKPVWKYMNPDMKIAACLVGWDDREIVHQCLAYGYIINYEPYNFKGRISDIPRTAEYGQKAQRLRRRLWDYLWNGRFADTVGAAVTVDAAKPFDYLYSVFENRTSGKKAVVLANHETDAELAATVRLESGGKPQSVSFDMYSLEDDTVAPCDGTVRIPPRSLVVLIER